jgi:hypothetical protein
LFICFEFHVYTEPRGRGGCPPKLEGQRGKLEGWKGKLEERQEKLEREKER